MNPLTERATSTLTVLSVLVKLEEQYDLEAGTLKDKQYRKPLKEVIMVCLVIYGPSAGGDPERRQ